MTTLNRPSWELSTRRGACRAAAYRRFTRANRRRSAFRQVWPRILLASVLLGALTCATAASADLIEFLAGSKLEGKVTKIDKQARTVTFDAVIAGSTLSRTYPYDKIHAVTMGDKRYVLTEKAGDGAPTSPGATGPKSPSALAAKKTTGPGGAAAEPKTLRSKADIEKLIADAGRAPPDWLEETPLDYPKSLDLEWPEKGPPQWNNQVNVGQYVWDVVNPNPSRWRSGLRLMHHLLTLHQEDAAKRNRDMSALGGMYFRFFQDYPRAAFWWKKAGVQAGEGESVSLAECYWRLGNKQMAVELLKSRTLRPEMVKLWGDMGETKQATDLADQLAPLMTKQGVSAGVVYLQAGDACRLAGRYPDAIRYYQKAIDEGGNFKGKVDQARKRAAANIEAIKLFELSNVRNVRDGTYRAKSLGYEGEVEVEVTVRAARIEDVKVVDHKEKQFYSAIIDMPRQIIRKQSVKGVDATSRATITAEAILNSTAKALASGAEQ